MKAVLRIIACLFLLSALLPAHAAFAAEDDERGLKGAGELGYVDTSGNTETESIIGSLKLQYLGQRWSHELELSAYFSSDSGETTAERYVGALQTNYHISERGHIFGRGVYVDDRFAGYDYRVKEVLGYGHRIIDAEKVALKLEAGPGGRHSRTTEGDRDDELMLYASADFLWKISGSASFTEDITTEVGENGTQTESVTAVKTSMTDNLSLKVSYTVRHNTAPPPGNRSTDTVLAATLVFDF